VTIKAYLQAVELVTLSVQLIRKAGRPQRRGGT